MSSRRDPSATDQLLDIAIASSDRSAVEEFARIQAEIGSLLAASKARATSPFSGSYAISTGGLGMTPFPFGWPYYYGNPSPEVRRAMREAFWDCAVTSFIRRHGD